MIPERHASLAILLLLLVADAGRTQSKPTKNDFGGPDSVERQLEPQYDVDTLQRVAKPWFDWKREFHEDTGITFGFWASLLYANASDVGSGDDDALGSIQRFQGSWDAFGPDSTNTGVLNFRVEHRNAVGGMIDPGALSGNVGMGALNTGFPYSDNFDVDLAVLSWKQTFDDTWGFDVGRLAFDVYLDGFHTQTLSGGFLNRSFLLNPSVAATGLGALGAVAKGFVASNVWLGGQIYDANAVNGEFDLNTIEEGEFLTAAEVGWTPDRSRLRTDRVQFTYWHKDARDEAGASSGNGWAVSASWQMGELLPFTRFGHSDGGGGAPAETAAAVGVEYKPAFDHILNLGLGWADLSDETFGSDADDESVAEASWRWLISPNFSVMPDVQYVSNPVNSPGEDESWVLSVRGILSF